MSCRECGAPVLAGGALDGRCARCLLALAIEESAESHAASGLPDTITRTAPSETAGLQPALVPALVLGDRYRLLRVLGRGGQGEVWHAFDLKLRVEVALKALRSDAWCDARAEERLRQEVRAARQVVSPNVCRVFDLIVADGHELVSMEFVDGTTLAALLQERGPLDLSHAGAIAAQFLAGLEAIHAAGFVHRDLKPENVMLTLAKRVVVMDFGIARHLEEPPADTIAGTPGYMAPEQAAGLPLDARADVYSAAVVLAEMMATRAGDTPARRHELWAALREDPPRVPPGPWSEMLRRALGRAPEGRYPSAGALARALELPRKLGGRAEQSPYPGLLSFTAEDAHVFFGREQEVETLVRQLRRPRLRAVLGPSGAGKTSFLMAGLLPALPAGWSAVACTPADCPFTAVAQALAPAFVGDREAVSLLSRFEDPTTALRLARRWRQRHAHALLVVDQAEELFTLNTLDVQRRFAELLGRLVLEADVHVLLSLRDDFLLHCRAFDAFDPIFAELLPLTPPRGAALRRALVQPALLSGYRFEDDRLVDDLLRDVAEERGTLPLISFAMARLWEARDRGRGLLTRQAYADIGGVAGALAQHAEATLERIGSMRVPLVRELLRNLVTAAGTRAVQDRDELLSVFGDQQRDAEDVLDALVEARLVTSFDAPSEEGAPSRRRVEIIHESLLAAWPRLARWRDQDAEGARLRDQLRQAAQLWDERGRPPDLLWSGPSFAEYLVWKARYPGGLTAREQAFGRAMEAHAGRRRRRARAVMGATFAALLIVLAIVSQLWMRSRASEAQALQQAQRAEAQQLFALGQVEEEANPTLAFAYALAALERADTEEIRRFALRQMWKGPLAFVVSEGSNGGASSLTFSPDGEWLADAGSTTLVWRRDGSGPRNASRAFLGNTTAHFVGDGRRMAIVGRRSSGTAGADVLSLPDLTELQRIETPGEALLAMRGDRLITVMPRAPRGSGADVLLRSFTSFTGTSVQKIGSLRGAAQIQIDASGVNYLISYRGSRELLASTLQPSVAKERTMLSTRAPISSFWLAENGERLALLDNEGALHVATIAEPRAPRHMPGLVIRAGEVVNGVAFDSVGRWLVAAVERQGLRMWDLVGPPNAEPLALGRGATTTATTGVVFEPSGRWLGAEDLRGVTFWPTVQRWPSVLRVATDQPRDVIFDPNGKWIAAASRKGGVEVWPLAADGPGRRQLVEGIWVSTLAVSPDGRFLATGTQSGSVLIRSASGSESIELRGFQGQVWAVAFDAAGRRIAATGRLDPRRSEIVRIFDLQSGDVKDLDPGDGKDIASLAFLPDGSLLTSSFGGLRRLDPKTGSSETLLAQPGLAFLGPDGRRVLLLHTENDNFPVGTASVYDLQEKRSWPLTTHGNQVTLMAWDPSGRHIVTGSRDGTVRVGPATDEEPHLLLGHGGPIWGVRVDPTGRLIASTSEDGTVRIWPTPEGQPLHTWPREALLEKLRSLTNVRVVPDSSTNTGYRVTFLPFQGWDRDPPTW